MVKAILTKPLDGQPEGTMREFDQNDFDTLKRMGAVREATKADAKSDEDRADSEEKAAEAHANKMAPTVANKAAPTSRAKTS